MTRIALARTKRLSVIIGFAAILLIAPSAAWAGSRHDDYDRHRSNDRYSSYSTYDRGNSHNHRHHASHNRHHRKMHKRHPLGKLRGYEKHRAGYYCWPCDRHFRARVGLRDHLAYRHRVPYRNFEVALSFGEFGWIFFGG